MHRTVNRGVKVLIRVLRVAISHRDSLGGVFMEYTRGIRRVFMGYTYVSGICRVCIGYVSGM